MRLSRDNLIVLGILAAITVCYVLVVYRSQSSALEKIDVRTAQTKRQLEQNMAAAGQVPPLLRQIGEMKRRYNKDWVRRLPQRKELAGFLREIASNLVQENLSNQIIQPGSATRGPLYNRLPISMQFEGEFLALARFLQRVDEMTRLTRIEHLKIAPAPDGRKLSMGLGMNIYFTEK